MDKASTRRRRTWRGFLSCAGWMRAFRLACVHRPRRHRCRRRRRLSFGPRKKTIIKKRVKKDIWQNLYDFPLIESLETVNNQTIMDLLNSNYKSVFSFEKIYLDKTENHKLSHQNLKLRFWIIKVSDSIVHGVSINNLNNYPFPKPLFSFINTLDRFLM